MSNEKGGIGGCLGLILTVLIIGAAFGFFEWSTVGKFVRILIYFFIAGLLFFGITLLWSYIRNKNN